AGDADVILAGGMESMSRAPYLLQNARQGWKLGDQKAIDAMTHDGLWCAFEDWHMGCAAEHIAGKCGIDRGEQDRFAVQSHRWPASSPTPPAASRRRTSSWPRSARSVPSLQRRSSLSAISTFSS